MRTPEQVAAGEALTAAIEALGDAYGVTGGSVLGDYIVLVAWDQVDDEGVHHSSSLFVRDNDMSRHRILGLIENQRQYLSAAAMLELSDQ